MECVTPEFPVQDVTATQNYFRNVLGFHIDWIWEDSFGSVTRGRVQLFFYKVANPQRGHSCYLFVENADTLYEEWKSRGVKVVEELGSQPWGMREFAIEDPNGHRFRVGHAEQTVDEIKEFKKHP